MTSRPQRDLFGNIAWFAGSVLVVGALIGGSVVRVAFGEAQVASLQQEIREKQEALKHQLGSDEERASQQSAKAALLECQGMIESESSRIAEISAAARAAGVTLVSLRSFGKEETEDGLIYSCSYELGGVGSYRQLARFFEGIYAARGMAAIDELEIEQEDVADPNRLLASLRVTWYAPDPAGESENEEEAIE